MNGANFEIHTPGSIIGICNNKGNTETQDNITVQQLSKLVTPIGEYLRSYRQTFVVIKMICRSEVNLEEQISTLSMELPLPTILLVTIIHIKRMTISNKPENGRN
jgi:hypothetical protein